MAFRTPTCGVGCRRWRLALSLIGIFDAGGAGGEAGDCCAVRPRRRERRRPLRRLPRPPARHDAGRRGPPIRWPIARKRRHGGLGGAAVGSRPGERASA